MRRSKIASFPMTKLLGRDLHDRCSVTAQNFDAAITRTRINRNDFLNQGISPLALHRREEFIQVTLAVLCGNQDRNAHHLNYSRRFAKGSYHASQNGWFLQSKITVQKNMCGGSRSLLGSTPPLVLTRFPQRKKVRAIRGSLARWTKIF